MTAPFDRYATEYGALLEAALSEPDYYAAAAVRDLVEDLPDWVAPRILDFGCGIGRSIPFLRVAFPRSSLIGTDLSAASVALARAQYPALTFDVFDGRRLWFPAGRFDVVFASGVFHHMPAEAQPGVLAELRRVLAFGGVLWIHEHNPWNPVTRAIVRACPFDADAALIRPAVLCRRVQAAGFRGPRVRYRRFFPRPLRALRCWEGCLTRLPLGAQYSVMTTR